MGGEPLFQVGDPRGVLGAQFAAAARPRRTASAATAITRRVATAPQTADRRPGRARHQGDGGSGRRGHQYRRQQQHARVRKFTATGRRLNTHHVCPQNNRLGSCANHWGDGDEGARSSQLGALRASLVPAETAVRHIPKAAHRPLAGPTLDPFRTLRLRPRTQSDALGGNRPLPVGAPGSHVPTRRRDLVRHPGAVAPAVRRPARRHGGKIPSSFNPRMTHSLSASLGRVAGRVRERAAPPGVRPCAPALPHAAQAASPRTRTVASMARSG